jgi:hypothetical protein
MMLGLRSFVARQLGRFKEPIPTREKDPISYMSLVDHFSPYFVATDQCTYMKIKIDVGLPHENDFPPSTARSILNFNERVEAAGVQIASGAQEAATERQIPTYNPMHSPISPPVVTHQLHASPSGNWMLNYFTPDNQKNADEQEYLAERSKMPHHEPQCQQRPQQGISALQSITGESSVEEATLNTELLNLCSGSFPHVDSHAIDPKPLSVKPTPPVEAPQQNRENTSPEPPETHFNLFKLIDDTDFSLEEIPFTRIPLVDQQLSQYMGLSEDLGELDQSSNNKLPSKPQNCTEISGVLKSFKGNSNSKSYAASSSSTDDSNGLRTQRDTTSMSGVLRPLNYNTKPQVSSNTSMGGHQSLPLLKRKLDTDGVFQPEKKKKRPSVYNTSLLRALLASRTSERYDRANSNTFLPCSTTQSTQPFAVTTMVAPENTFLGVGVKPVKKT